MKQQYHHGNLQSALVAEAINLLESEGLAALSLRRVARQVGVSQAAPYSHFKDKQALLVAVCAAGYRQFTARMKEEAGNEEGPAYIAGLGRGYIYFALENPALFELMFSGDIRDDEPRPPEFEEGYLLLDEGLARYPIPYFQDDQLSRAISWGLVHGLAHLLLSQRIDPKIRGYANVKEFVHAAMDKFVGNKGQ